MKDNSKRLCIFDKLEINLHRLIKIDEIKILFHENVKMPHINLLHDIKFAENIKSLQTFYVQIA